MSPQPSSVVQYLLKDRMAEFQKIALEKGGFTAEKEPKRSTRTSEISNAQKAAFMRDFFEAIGKIQTSLSEGRENVKLMAGVLEDALLATTQEKEKAASDRLSHLVEQTAESVLISKRGLEVLKLRMDSDEGQRCTPGETKIQANMHLAMAKKQQQLVLDFQKAQIDYKKQLERRQDREMQILMPDASEEERAHMIEAGETTTLVVAKRMAGAHALLLDEVQRIRDKHQDILRLEQNIADLASMFQEMAVLVDSQGELLDAIEVHVAKAKDCTAKAEQNLIITRKVQYATQKKMCCLTAFLVIVALAIIFPLLLKK